MLLLNFCNVFFSIWMRIPQFTFNGITQVFAGRKMLYKEGYFITMLDGIYLLTWSIFINANYSGSHNIKYVVYFHETFTYIICLNGIAWWLGGFWELEVMGEINCAWQIIEIKLFGKYFKLHFLLYITVLILSSYCALIILTCTHQHTRTLTYTHTYTHTHTHYICICVHVWMCCVCVCVGGSICL